MHSPEDEESPLDSEENKELMRQLAARLPEDLRFIADFPDLVELNAEEVEQFSESYLGKLREKRERLLALGLPVDQMIVDTTAKCREFLKATQETEAAEDRLLEATANSADAQYKLFKAMDAAVQTALEINPFDPQAQEMKEQLDEWRKHMPKE